MHIQAGSCSVLISSAVVEINMLADGFESNEASRFVNATPLAKCD